MVLLLQPGFGTGTSWYKEDPNEPLDPELVKVLTAAIKQGIRHIDGADCYGTEAEIGIAIQQAGIPRHELFVTTKVLDGLDDVQAAFAASLQKLKLDYVDLYLIHSPYAARDETQLQAAWREMEKIKASGKAKHIGVSNHQRHHLQSILDIATIKPAVNQLEFHPYLQRAQNFVPWMQEQGVLVTSFNGLTPITKAQSGPLSLVLPRIAEAHGVSEVTVLMQWQLQQDVIPITTTRKVERLKECLSVGRFALTFEEMEEVTQVGQSFHYRAWASDRFDTADRS